MLGVAAAACVVVGACHWCSGYRCVSGQGSSGIILCVFCCILQGLSEDVSINKFFDEPMLLKLADTEVDDPIAALMGQGGGW